MAEREATPLFSRLLAVALGVLLLYVAYRETVVAYAHQLSADRSPAGLAAAVSLAPDDADLWREQARAMVGADPSGATALFERALTCNPADAAARVALGLLAESFGRIEEAERHFRAAAGVSRRLRPQLALAFFYARQGPIEEFWPAANRAAAIEGADLKPLFAVAHALVPDPAQVATRLTLSSRHAVASYTRFLLDRPERTPIETLALRLDPGADRPLLLAVADRLVREGRLPGAIRVWNHIYPGALDPAAGRSLVNPDFTPGDGVGFDWRHTPSFGVQLRRAPGDLRIEFSGRQTETVVLLEQTVVVLPRRGYRLSWIATQTGSPLRPGLSWRLGGSRHRAPLPPTSDASGVATFTTAPGESSVTLALHYQRPAGSTRLEGVVTLRSVELTLQ